MSINLRRSQPRGRLTIMCATATAFLILAGLSGLRPVLAQTTSVGTNFSVSIERGAGTGLNVTVTNTGPRPVVAVAGPTRKVTSGFSLTFDKGSSGSTYMVAATITASEQWRCGAAYDVVNCVEPGAFGVGQTMTMSVPMNLCYPSDHAYVLYYWTNDNGELGNHDQNASFSGPGGGCTSNHIGFVKIFASPALRSLAAQYRDQLATLAEQKQSLEDSLGTKAARVAVAQQELDRSANAVASLVSQVAQTEAFVKQINQQEQALPDSVRAELQSRDSLDESIASLQDQIVVAEQAGNTALAKSLTERLDRELSQLATISRELLGKDEIVDQTIERWLAKLRLLNKQLFAARTHQVSALSDLSQADANLETALGERGALDQQLFSLAEQIAILNIGVTGISVNSSLGTASGADRGIQSTVFSAQLPSNPLVIDQLDKDIASVGESVADLDRQRDAALSNFLGAEQRASEALDNVTQVIWSTAKKKAVVDFISNLIDVIKAAKNGGLIGASAETLKKVVETLVKEYAVESGPGKYGSKGAQEFNADFNAKLTNAYFGKLALKTGVERLVKETVTKKGKDALNESIGTLVFQKVYGNVPALYEQAAGQRLDRPPDRRGNPPDPTGRRHQGRSVRRPRGQLRGPAGQSA